MITVTAPGKLMILGEHAVVYGYPCIVTAVNKRLSVSMEQTETGKVEVETQGIHDTRFVDAAITHGCEAWGIAHTGLRITTSCDFSGVFGFGSSSAVTVATLGALTALFEKTIDFQSLFDVSYKTILAVQGVGSGFDVAAAVFGGTMVYTKGAERLEQFDETPDIIVGYSGVKADTVAIVQSVAKKRAEYPEKVERIFQAITQLVEQTEAAWKENDWETVGKYMNFNQEYLRDLGVSTEKLETLIAASKHAGAYGAKLSGAGGGDCMIALVSPEKRGDVVRAITESGGEVVDVSCGEEGVREEI